MKGILMQSDSRADPTAFSFYYLFYSKLLESYNRSQSPEHYEDQKERTYYTCSQVAAMKSHRFLNFLLT